MMSADPLLSIVIPHYNAPHTLSLLLDNILSQTLKRLEVIVVDDGSRETCREVVDAWRNKGLNLCLIEHDANRGAYEARLTGMGHVHSRAVAFADADDLFWGVEALEQHVRLLLQEEADIVHFNTMNWNRETGYEHLNPRQKPFAAVLTAEEVFASYANRRWWTTLWGKLFSGNLCRACLPVARTWSMTGCSEDVYLASLFFSQAQKYRGSALAGYRYHTTPSHIASRRKAEHICNLYATAEWFNIWLREKHLTPAVIAAYKKNVANFALMHAASLEQDASMNTGVFDPNAFRLLADGTDMAVLDQALDFALAEGGNMAKEKSAALRLRQQIFKLHLSA
jgi:hypothetical protein